MGWGQGPAPCWCPRGCGSDTASCLLLRAPGRMDPGQGGVGRGQSTVGKEVGGGRKERGGKGGGGGRLGGRGTLSQPQKWRPRTEGQMQVEKGAREGRRYGGRRLPAQGRQESWALGPGPTESGSCCCSRKAENSNIQSLELATLRPCHGGAGGAVCRL